MPAPAQPPQTWPIVPTPAEPDGGASQQLITRMSSVGAAEVGVAEVGVEVVGVEVVGAEVTGVELVGAEVTGAVVTAAIGASVQVGTAARARASSETVHANRGP